MPIIPTPPTDNLYKFIAIFGMWAFGFAVLFFSTLIFASYKYEVLLGQQTEVMRVQGLIDTANRRIAALDAGQFDKYKITWLTGYEHRPTDEKKFLEGALKFWAHDLGDRRATVQRELDSKFDQVQLLGAFSVPVDDYVKLLGLKWIILIIEIPLCMSGLMMWFGFIQWYHLYQKPYDLQIKAAMKSQLLYEPRSWLGRISDSLAEFKRRRQRERRK